jgi:hypothetical protein
LRVASDVWIVISPPSPAVLERMTSWHQRNVNAVVPQRRAASQPHSCMSRRRAPNNNAGACSTRDIISSRWSNCSGTVDHAWLSGRRP